MKPLISSLLFWAIFSLSGSLQAQDICGFDAHRDPASEAILNAQIQHALTSYDVSASRDVITIPVVFHVMHDGANGNVSDAQVAAAIDELNLRFSNSAPYTHPTGNPVNIQFCLASVDPDGNPSTGINRVDDPTYAYLTTTTDLELKNRSRWAPILYMNVWLVVDIPGFVAGYATFPNHAGDDVDGIVMESLYLNDSYVLAHEVGHYFLLYHTFEGGCYNDDCASQGDNVCDTPPDVSQLTGNCVWNSCSTDADDPSEENPFSSDVDELPNYMDYTLCPLSFTQGQALRMEVAFQTHRSALGQSNGCGAHPNGALPVANISVDSTSLCTGRYVLSSTGASVLYAAWDFNEDGLFESGGTQIEHAFSTSGFKTVRLLAIGYGGADTSEVTFYVRVGATPYYPMVYPSSGLSIDPFFNTLFACEGIDFEIETEGTFASYAWSDGSTLPSLAFTSTTSFEYSLIATDSLGRSWRSCESIAAQITPSYGLSLNVGDTVGCGTYVLVKFDPIPYYNTPNNTWYQNGNVIAHNQWNVPQGAWNLGLQEFYVENVSPIGCVTTTDTISYFVPEVELPTITQSNDTLILSHDCLNVNWFLDGQVLLFAPNDSFLVITQPGCYHAWCQQCGNFTTEDFCVTPLSVGQFGDDFPIKIYPNPAKDQFQVDLSQLNPKIRVDMKVYTSKGELILQKVISDKNTNVELHVASGVYYALFMNIESGTILSKQKLIIH